MLFRSLSAYDSVNTGMAIIPMEEYLNMMTTVGASGAALLEAMALNFADNADAKMETMIEVLRGAGDNQGWLGYNRLLETNIRKTTDC